MVKRFYKYFLPVLLLGVFTLESCDVDVFGLFASTDLDERWQARNIFNYPGFADRNISLGDTYSFLVLGDTHIVNGNASKLEGLKAAIDSEVKFVVINGDITQNGKREDVGEFIRVAMSLGVPCYPVVGNHDIYFGNWPVWKELIGSTCYRIDGGGTTLFILDSANAYFGDKQLGWLEDELKKTSGRVFVFTHANLFVEKMSDRQEFTEIRERARITSLLKGRCSAMLMGHVHRRSVKQLDSVSYITIEDYKDNSVYCQIWVSGNGIRWEFKKL